MLIASTRRGEDAWSKILSVSMIFFSPNLSGVVHIPSRVSDGPYDLIVTCSYIHAVIRADDADHIMR